MSLIMYYETMEIFQPARFFPSNLKLRDNLKMGAGNQANPHILCNSRWNPKQSLKKWMLSKTSFITQSFGVIQLKQR